MRAMRTFPTVQVHLLDWGLRARGGRVRAAARSPCRLPARTPSTRPPSLQGTHPRYNTDSTRPCTRTLTPFCACSFLRYRLTLPFRPWPPPSPFLAVLNLDPSCPTSNSEPHPSPLHLGCTPPPQHTRLLYPLRTPSSSQRSTYRYSRWDPLDSTPRLESPATSGERGTLVPTPREARLSTRQGYWTGSERGSHVEEESERDDSRGCWTWMRGRDSRLVGAGSPWGRQGRRMGPWERQRDRQHPTRTLRCLSSQVPDHSPFHHSTGCSRSRVLPLRRRLPSTLERFVPPLLPSPPTGLGL